MSSDGSFIVALTRLGNLLLFSRDGRLLWKLYTRVELVDSVSISSDGSYIAVAEGTILLFSRDGRLLWILSNYTLVYTYPMRIVSISSDGSYIVAGASHAGYSAVLLFSRDGRLLWTYRTGFSMVNSVSISSDGSYIAVGAGDTFQSAVLLLSRDGRPLWVWKYNKPISANSVSISSDGSYIAVATLNAVLLFSRDGRLLLNYSVGYYVNSVSISSDGSYIAVAKRSPGFSEKGNVLLFSRDGRLLLNYSTDLPVHSVSISSDGSYIAALLRDSKIYFFGLSREATPPILTLYDPQIAGLTVSINGVAAPGYKDAKITRIHVDWGDGFSQDHSFPASHTYSKPGTYTITVTAYQSDGLSTTKTLVVKVEAENIPPVADFSYTPSRPLAGEAVSFIDKSYDPDGNIVFWRWDFGDGATSSDRNPTHVYIFPGTYKVTLTVRDDKGAEKSITKTIQVEAVQAVSTSNYMFPLATIMLGVLVVLATSYILAKRRTPKPPPLPPPPPPS
jgi:WD40 repeat protein